MKTKSFTASRRLVFDACLKALKHLGCEMESDDYHNGSIKAKKAGGLRSYGHTIIVTIKSTESKKIKVRVKSDSIGIQLIDWGTNLENEDRILEEIASELE